MASDWSVLPVQDAAITPYKVAFAASKIDDMKALVKASPIGPKTFYNSDPHFTHGVTHEWLVKAKDTWLNSFSWPDIEAKLNRHPHFMAKITDDAGHEYDIHFMAIFSRRKDAIPVGFFHGWPGSFYEFMDLVDEVKTRYTPETSPYHIIVPSLPGYTLSSGPPPDHNFDVDEVAVLMDKLFVKLGFENGYVAQGGDVGSWVTQGLAHISNRCKAIHLNMLFIQKPADAPEPQNDPEVTPDELKYLAKGQTFSTTGIGYAIEHGTRTATISFVLASSPLAVLAWVGEKMLEWADPASKPTLEQILTNVSLYWLTDSLSRNLYPYLRFIEFNNAAKGGSPPTAPPKIKQPIGFSRFVHDVVSPPRKWAAAVGNLTYFQHHDDGGHFAALERPGLLWGDVEAFLKQEFPKGF